MGRLLTAGHGTLDRDALGTLLAGAGTDLLVDVRRFPGSRHNPGADSWWRCHRRLVADAALLLRDLDVAHLAHNGRATPHEPSAGARVVDGLLHYDVPAEG